MCLQIALESAKEIEIDFFPSKFISYTDRVLAIGSRLKSTPTVQQVRNGFFYVD